MSLSGKVAIITGGGTGIGFGITQVLAGKGVKLAIARFGRINILVNNASVTGMPAIASFLDGSPAKVDQIVDVNPKGAFYCSQLVARRMAAAGQGGSVVHIASVGAYAAQEFASLYCATKAAQVSLARSLRRSVRPYW